ncbi:MAG: ribosome small subunit-dependent GTPase A [Bacilli bacterium]
MIESGRVTSNIASNFKVYKNGAFYNCSLRGSFRISSKNIKVGDYVVFDDESLVIVDIVKRNNEFTRPCIANVDQAFIVNSIEEPEFSKYLVLKYITYVKFNQIQPIVIFTKNDIKKNTKIDDFIAELRNAEIRCIVTASNDASSIAQIKELLDGKTSLFFGQTGAGKSTLINMIEPFFNRLIGEYSIFLNRGKHRTKETILLPINDNTFLVDTPGFSSLDLEMNISDIRTNFPLIERYRNSCKFDDCKHINEPECSVKKDVKMEIIPIEWYNIYVDLMENKNEH